MTDREPRSGGVGFVERSERKNGEHRRSAAGSVRPERAERAVFDPGPHRKKVARDRAESGGGEQEICVGTVGACPREADPETGYITRTGWTPDRAGESQGARVVTAGVEDVDAGGVRPDNAAGPGLPRVLVDA